MYLDDVAARWLAAMRSGDFEEAWRQTDRIEVPRRAREAVGDFTRGPEHLVWNGAPFEGRDVLVRCAHGLGDTLQFIRYVPWLRERARSVAVLAPRELVDVLEDEPAFGRIYNRDSPPQHLRYDVAIESMELAYAFRSSPETLPKRVPYLPIQAIKSRVHETLVDRRAARFHVGLVWAAGEWDKTRSLPLELLAPLTAVRDTRFHSLQQGTEADEWRRVRFDIEPLAERTRSVLFAAAAILELDLVITVDSMVAHVAGALGKPVWVMLKRDADWRWMDDRADSPWYPTMRLFRQRSGGDWADVVNSVAGALMHFTCAHSPSS